MPRLQSAWRSRFVFTGALFEVLEDHGDPSAWWFSGGLFGALGSGAGCCEVIWGTARGRPPRISPPSTTAAPFSWLSNGYSAGELFGNQAFYSLAEKKEIADSAEYFHFRDGETEAQRELTHKDRQNVHLSWKVLFPAPRRCLHHLPSVGTWQNALHLFMCLPLSIF